MGLNFGCTAQEALAWHIIKTVRALTGQQITFVSTRDGTPTACLTPDQLDRIICAARKEGMDLGEQLWAAKPRPKPTMVPSDVPGVIF